MHTWPTGKQIKDAISHERLDILSPTPDPPFAWIPTLQVLLLSGTVFGERHLGMAEWKDPSVGFCINNKDARSACARLIAARLVKSLPALVILTPQTRAHTGAELGLDALKDPTRIIQIQERQLVPAEVFLSRFYGDPIPRLRNPTPVST